MAKKIGHWVIGGDCCGAARDLGPRRIKELQRRVREVSKSGDTAAVKKAFWRQTGGGANAKDEDGHTPLHEARKVWTHRRSEAC